MTIFEITEIIGVISFTLSGFFVGVREKLDTLGIVIVSFSTALGGGVLRDIIIDKIPYSLQNYFPPILVILTIFFAIYFKLYKKESMERRTIFIVADSIGLVSFSITGAIIGIEANLNFFGVVLLAFVTAVGGGIIRDSIINRIPFVLKSEFYGTVSILIASLFYILYNLFHPSIPIVTLITFIFGISLRLLAYFRNWHLPTFH